jgi:hypothetical protein
MKRREFISLLGRRRSRLARHGNFPAKPIGAAHRSADGHFKGMRKCTPVS